MWFMTWVSHEFQATSWYLKEALYPDALILNESEDNLLYSRKRLDNRCSHQQSVSNGHAVVLRVLLTAGSSAADVPILP